VRLTGTQAVAEVFELPYMICCLETGQLEGTLQAKGKIQMVTRVFKVGREILLWNECMKLTLPHALCTSSRILKVLFS